MAALKLGKELHQGGDAVHRTSVVDARTESADGPVTLDAREACGVRLLQQGGLQLALSQTPGDVHLAARTEQSVRGPKVAGVEEIIEGLSLDSVALSNGIEPLVFDPSEHSLQRVDAQCVRGVEELLLRRDVCGPLEHGRGVGGRTIKLSMDAADGVLRTPRSARAPPPRATPDMNSVALKALTHAETNTTYIESLQAGTNNLVLLDPLTTMRFKKMKQEKAKMERSLLLRGKETHSYRRKGNESEQPAVLEKWRRCRKKWLDAMIHAEGYCQTCSSTSPGRREIRSRFLGLVTVVVQG